MTRSELDAAVSVVKRALEGITFMGIQASTVVKDQQIRDITQDALQAAEDVRRARERADKMRDES